MSFWCETTPKARKAHLCDECLKPIEPGATYTRGAGINVHGNFGAWTTHTDCLAATHEVMKDNEVDDDWYPLHESVWEMEEDGLAWLALEYPAVFERFRAELVEHERMPDHYKWRGAPASYVPPRRAWYRWTR